MASITWGNWRSLSAAARRTVITWAPWPPVVKCYVDMKSPHAYLVLGPMLQVAQDYEVPVQFLPYQLDLVKIGITTHHSGDGSRTPPDEHADRRARMFYTTAREYAKLQGLTIRGPYKLLNSRLGNLGLLWARRYGGVEAAFMKTVFDAGWPSGWRTYDLEDPRAIRDTLAEVGADNPDGYLAEDFLVPGGAGDLEMAATMRQAEESGCVGVPHLEWKDPSTGRLWGLYGREHLSSLRLNLHEAALWRNELVQPHISHAWEPRK